MKSVSMTGFLSIFKGFSDFLVENNGYQISPLDELKRAEMKRKAENANVAYIPDDAANKFFYIREGASQEAQELIEPYKFENIKNLIFVNSDKKLFKIMRI